MLAQLPASDIPAPPVATIFPETTIPVFQHQIGNRVWSDIIGISNKTNSIFLIGTPLYLPSGNDNVRMTNGVIKINAFTETQQIISGQGLSHYNKRHWCLAW